MYFQNIWYCHQNLGMKLANPNDELESWCCQVSLLLIILQENFLKLWTDIKKLAPNFAYGFLQRG